MVTRLGFTFDAWLARNPAPEPVNPAGRVTCDLCEGDGGVPIGDERCPTCHGFGHVPEPEQLRIDPGKAAWEATRPDYDTACHARIAAGHEPY